MGQNNWTLMTGSPGTDVISWGQSNNAEFEAPDGEGVLAFFTRTPFQGASAVILDWTVDGTWGPLPGGRGGLIASFIRKFNKGPESAPFMFLADSPDINSAQGYCLGLSEDYPCRLVLKKGLLASGLGADSPDNLWVSSWTWDDRWLAVALVVTTHAQGDVVLRVYTNVVVLEATYIDDVLGGNQGQPPISGNYWAGLGHYNRSGTGGLSLFDYVSVASQTE